jgi:hypothetical protein
MANNDEPFFVRPEGSVSDTDSTGSADTDWIWIELTVNVKPKHSLTGEIPHSIRFRLQNVNTLSRRALSADSDSQKTDVDPAYTNPSIFNIIKKR